MVTDVVPLPVVLTLSGLLFAIGAGGVVVRRNAMIVFACIRLLLNAVNLAFVGLSPHAGFEGQVIVFFVIAVAAAEAAVGLALIIAVFRHALSVDLENFRLLRW